MRRTSIVLIFLLVTELVHAESSALRLLKRDLGQSIEVVSKREIRYCPDNTCDIAKSKKATNLLPEFMYLYLFHESGYIELGKSFNSDKPFRETAIEEPEVRKAVERYCPDGEKTPKCILDGMRLQLGIKSCFARYDEGYFCYGCSEHENICKKL